VGGFDEDVDRVVHHGSRPVSCASLGQYLRPGAGGIRASPVMSRTCSARRIFLGPEPSAVATWPRVSPSSAAMLAGVRSGGLLRVAGKADRPRVAAGHVAGLCRVLARV